MSRQQVGAVTLCASLLCGAAAGPVDTLVCDSPVMQRQMRTLVFLPSGYEAKRARGQRFPVVYLLHCAGCTEARWADATYADIDGALDRYELIAVAPYDGTSEYGYGWWLDSPKVPGSQLATFVAVELKTRVDSAYATLTDRGNTALAGHSMGGFGSFHLLIEHNSVFGIAVPIKAGVDLRNPLRTSWGSDFGLLSLLGSAPEDSVYWQAVNVLANAHQLVATQQRIRFYSGQYDGWFSGENRELDALLDSLGVAHEFVELQEDHFAVAPSLMLEVCAYVDSVCARGPQEVRPRAAPGRGRGGMRRGAPVFDLRGQRRTAGERQARGAGVLGDRANTILIR